MKLVDFGLAKEGVSEAAAGASSLCGTPEYLSPEVLDRQGHGTAVDWWVSVTNHSLHCLCCVMVRLPFYSLTLPIGGTWAW